MKAVSRCLFLTVAARKDLEGRDRIPSVPREVTGSSGGGREPRQADRTKLARTKEEL